MRAELAREEAEARRAELEARLERQRERAEREREEARARAREELAAAGRELADLRRQISAARRAETARGRAATGAAAASRTRDRDRRLGDASAAERRAARALEQAVGPVGGHGPVAVGDRVVDASMGFRGVVVATEGDMAEVQGERLRMRVPVARLAPDGRGGGAPAPAPPPAAEVRPPVQAAPQEVDVRGERAEAARAAVREAVDLAAMAGRERLRIIHGHGTGALRAAVREELGRHPLVERAEPAPPNQGGDGATYAVFRSG
jgi:DNA mismatch repair protein MutS2